MTRRLGDISSSWRSSFWFVASSRGVDVVVEDLAGQLVGIEVKASATVRREDFRGLKKLVLAGGEGFRLGVVLYDGDRVLPFGERLFAAPISALWT
jgi:hypothetical protein